jgi:hypothetical protein
VFEALAPIILLEFWAPSLSAYAKGLVGGRLPDVMGIHSIIDKILRTENHTPALASIIDANDKTDFFQKLHANFAKQVFVRWAPPLSYYSRNLRVAPRSVPRCNPGPDDRKRTSFSPSLPSSGTFITPSTHIQLSICYYNVIRYSAC